MLYSKPEFPLWLRVRDAEAVMHEPAMRSEDEKQKAPVIVCVFLKTAIVITPGTINDVTLLSSRESASVSKGKSGYRMAAGSFGDEYCDSCQKLI